MSKFLETLRETPFLPLVLALGGIWVMGGVLNAADVSAPDGPQRYGALIGQVWSEGIRIDLPVGPTLYLPDSVPPNPVPGMRAFLRDWVAPNAQAVMLTMAALEILVGLSVLSGFLTRYALPLGMLMNVGILLAAGHTHPAILRVNLLMAAAGASLYLVRQRRPYGFDVLLRERFADSRLVRAACS